MSRGPLTVPSVCSVSADGKHECFHYSLSFLDLELSLGLARHSLVGEGEAEPDRFTVCQTEGTSLLMFSVVLKSSACFSSYWPGSRG